MAVLLKCEEISQIEGSVLKSTGVSKYMGDSHHLITSSVKDSSFICHILVAKDNQVNRGSWRCWRQGCALVLADEATITAHI